MIFLVEYNRSEGRLIRLRSFTDADRQAAEEARLDTEVRLKDDSDCEVVILQAASEEIVRRTHRRYFERIEDLTSIPATETKASA